MKKIALFCLTLFAFNCTAMEVIETDLAKEYEKEVTEFLKSQKFEEFCGKLRSDDEKEQIIKILKDKDADYCGTTGLHLAARLGQYKLTELLLSLGVDVNISGNGTPLMAAAFTGHTKIVQLLLDKGADATSVDGLSIMGRGATALGLAAQKGHTDIVAMLLKHGAEIHVNNNLPFAPLDGGANHKDYKLIKMLLKHGALLKLCHDYNPILEILYDNGEDIPSLVQLLQDQKVDVDEKLIRGGKPLYHAAEEGQIIAVEVLLKAGADVNELNWGHTSALFIAAKKGHVALCELLLDHGAKINSQNGAEETAFIAAIRNNHIDVCKLLLDRGANPDAKDKDGRTALLIATTDKQEDICKLLLDQGADIDAKDDKGKTALIHASWDSNEDMCRLLVDLGADINAKDNDQCTPLENAVEKSNENICKLLLDHGAKIDQETGLGFNLLQLAAMNNSENICKILLNHGFILPKVDSKKVAQYLKEYVNVIMLLKRQKVPKDLNNMVLLAGWIEEIEEVIKKLIGKGKAHLIPAVFKRIKEEVISECAQMTLDEFKKQMESAVWHASNDTMRNLLKPEALDSEKIKGSLLSFSQSKKE